MQSRRQFLQLLTVASIGVRLKQRANLLRRPPALRQGMTVGIVAPAGPVQPRQLKTGIAFFESLGLRIVLGRYLNAHANSYLAAPDQDRAAELMDFLLRSDIDAVVCARGGYGVLRILPLLDFTALQQCTKPVIGYSDITALLIALHERTGLVTFHGPMASSEFDATTAGSFIATLVQFDSEHLAPTEVQLSYSDERFIPVVSGTAEGKLLGGNLSVFCSLLGTPFEPDTRDCILFFEDIGEEPYKVDRMFMQLRLAGKFEQARGLILGAFTKQSPRSNEPTAGDTGTMIAQIAAEHFGSRPIIANVPIGHIRSKITLPIGVHARIESTQRTIQLLDAPVQFAP